MIQSLIMFGFNLIKNDCKFSNVLKFSKDIHTHFLINFFMSIIFFVFKEIKQRIQFS